MRILDVRNELINMLKNAVVFVRFKKADGTIRDMRATLLEDYISVKTASKSNGPEHLITVWDVDKDAWRSFKIDSVIEFKEQDNVN